MKEEKSKDVSLKEIATLLMALFLTFTCLLCMSQNIICNQKAFNKLIYLILKILSGNMSPLQWDHLCHSMLLHS